MTDDTSLPFDFSAVGRKKSTAAFDGGRLSSDGGVMLLAMAERRLGVAERHARLVPDRRGPTRITHTLADMIRARIFAICCGYEDADDLDHLHGDPAFYQGEEKGSRPGVLGMIQGSGSVLPGAWDAGIGSAFGVAVFLCRP